MPIRRELKAFWWFVEGRIGGWGVQAITSATGLIFSLEEGLVFSWLGKQHQTSSMIESLWAYLDVYGPKVAPFYSLSRAEVCGRLRSLRERDTLLTVVQSMNAKAGILQEVTWQDNGTHTMLHFPPNVQRLHHEVAMLKHYNVSVVISLLEQPWVRQPWRHILRSIISQWRTSRRRAMSRCMPLRTSSILHWQQGKRGDSLPGGRRTYHDYATLRRRPCAGAYLGRTGHLGADV